jgi:hypothetical protein
VTSRQSFLASLGAGQLGGRHGDFVIVEWSDSGESGYECIAPLHVHHADDEAWYVLEVGAELRWRVISAQTNSARQLQQVALVDLDRFISTALARVPRGGSEQRGPTNGVDVNSERRRGG